MVNDDFWNKTPDRASIFAPSTSQLDRRLTEVEKVLKRLALDVYPNRVVVGDVPPGPFGKVVVSDNTNYATSPDVEAFPADQARIDELMIENEALKERIKDLELEVQDLTRENDSLYSENADLGDQLSTIRMALG